jgi:Ser/Thr protein kinase RdoA (MazF antagonist)
MTQPPPIHPADLEPATQSSRLRESFPVTYSILSPTRLAIELQTEYPLTEPITCHILHLGVNDTYLIHTAQQPYILRVYRAGWRAIEDIHYELDLLTHLYHKGVPVATPIARLNGQRVHLLSAPEGVRPTVLFTYAPGTKPQTTAPYVRPLGRTIARLHTAADDFVSHAARFPLDLAYFLDRPLQFLQPLLAHHDADWTDLVSIAEAVRARAQQLPLSALEWGACHGDIDWKNVHIADEQTITLFDFDHGGASWRAYDLATFRIRTPEDAIWNDFLQGYQAERPISDLDLAAVPLFVVMIRIYALGFTAAHRENTPWGMAMLNGGFIESELGFLREWMRTQV